MRFPGAGALATAELVLTELAAFLPLVFGITPELSAWAGFFV